MAIIAGPFGLIGFGLSTMLVGLGLAGVWSPLFSSVNTGMALALGMSMQFIGAVLAIIHGEMVAAFAFAGYAFFWMSWALIFVLPNQAFGIGAGGNGLGLPNNDVFYALGFYHLVWLMFTFFNTICVWRPKSNWVLRAVFVTLDIAFALLAIADFVATAAFQFNKTTGAWEVKPGTTILDSPPAKSAGSYYQVNQAAGIVTTICGFLAFYLAHAEVVNQTYGRQVMWIGGIEAPKKTDEALKKTDDHASVQLVTASPHASPSTL